MEMIFFILWCISVVFNLIYMIQTIIRLKNDGDYNSSYKKLIISYIFVALFCILVNIT